MDDLDAPLREHARGALPAGVAVMRLCRAAPSLAEARAALDAVERDGLELPEAKALLTDRAFELVNRVLGRAAHGSGGAPETWAATFDALAAEPGEAGSALYALADPERLEAATAEAADWLVRIVGLGPDATVLEIGCGSGRVLRTLGGRVRFAAGLDVSEAMAKAARKAGASTVRTSGRDLAAFRDGAFDLVLAVDSWPYLVDAGVEAEHLVEARRVLKRTGRLAVLNWSYGDESGAIATARAAGLEAEIAGVQPFRLWDGRGYVFRPA